MVQFFRGVAPLGVSSECIIPFRLFVCLFVCLVFVECVIPLPDTLNVDMTDAINDFNQNNDEQFVMTDQGIRTTEA